METNERLDRYKDLLLTWNRRVNLIGPEARDNLDAHIAEATAAAAILQARGDCLDFGSGGGLPAIPMAIVSPAARFFLVEADQKKWAFLKHVVRECELNAVILGDRLSAVLPKLAPGQRFSLITSRAVGNPEEWVPLLSGRVVSGGRIALFQTGQTLPEGLGAEDVRSFRLPRGDQHYLVTFVPRGTAGRDHV